MVAGVEQAKDHSRLVLGRLDMQGEDGRFWREVLWQSEQGTRLRKQMWMMLWLTEVLEHWLSVGRLHSKTMCLELIEASAMRQDTVTRVHPARLMGAEIRLPVVVRH